MDLAEAEIQVLASLHEAEIELRPTDRASLEKGGERYWIFLEDWSDAYPSLIAKGLIEGDDSEYRLTPSGRPLGETYYDERPDRMWYYYQKFWKAAFESAAHSRFCERVFGKDLCQDGMVDMSALGDLLARLSPQPGDRLLDLGCGAGVITEYVSDVTGASITGLDNASEAISVATERTSDKRDRLIFVKGDLNALELPQQDFDTVVSLDSLYWANDLTETVSRIVQAVKPGGQIGVFMMQGPWDSDPPGVLAAEDTELGRVLSQLSLSYEAIDYTEKNVEFWKRNWRTAVDMLDEFEAEGNGFIAQSLIKEAEKEFLPAIAANKMTRHLYHIKM